MSDVQDILIKVEPEKLEALAGRVNSKIEAIKGRFERIESEVNNSNHYWKGEGGETHRRVYQQSKEGIEESLENFKGMVSALETMAGTYRSTETEVISSADGLPADVII